MDKFVYFATVPKDTQELLSKYESPESEVSIWKGIPIAYLDQIRQALSRAGQFRVKFRGPRYDHQRGTCLKENAHSFAVYPL
jgi:hypothetical protein